ncbi:hypothetical protein EV660_11138 [Roseinatronobacter bogoriensis DSM 18756]|nr:hypothetical protein [Rhodobaca bogoriensis DSM 18756]TDY66428.1 hypothetical protein EV660_11138 [Rhodobaca bogoriensis DSM 18756]
MHLTLTPQQDLPGITIQVAGDIFSIDGTP